jgi:hypothetical protein
VQVYHQSSSSLRFSLIVDGKLKDADIIDGQYQVSATVTRLADNVVIISDELVERESTGMYKLTLTPSHTSSLGKYKLEWKYTVSGSTHIRTTSFDVVIPYASASQVRAEFPELANKSDDEIYRKEKLARKVIETICNQSFDFELNKTYKVLGRDADILRLPKRIWKLNSVKLDGVDDITSSVEIHENHFLRAVKLPWDVNLERKFFDVHLFRAKVIYHVNGNWGWEFVPEEVQQAASLLIRDYFNDEYMLRQHGIWQMDVGDEGYRTSFDVILSGSGNVDVDALLSNFIRPRFEVI